MYGGESIISHLLDGILFYFISVRKKNPGSLREKALFEALKKIV
jgi:hypothetical protein